MSLSFNEWSNVFPLVLSHEYLCVTTIHMRAYLSQCWTITQARTHGETKSGIIFWLIFWRIIAKAGATHSRRLSTPIIDSVLVDHRFFGIIIYVQLFHHIVILVYMEIDLLTVFFFLVSWDVFRQFFSSLSLFYVLMKCKCTHISWGGRLNARRRIEDDAVNPLWEMF